MSHATPPTPLEDLVAALVEDRGRVIAREVIVELAGRFGLRIPGPDDVERALGIAESWEQCATKSRQEASALRRQAGEDASTIAVLRAEVGLFERLAAGFQLERDQVRRLLELANEETAQHQRLADLARAERGLQAPRLASETYRADAAVEQLEASKASASRSVEAGLEWRARAEAAERKVARITDLLMDAVFDRRIARIHGHARARRLLAALREARGPRPMPAATAIDAPAPVEPPPAIVAAATEPWTFPKKRYLPMARLRIEADVEAPRAVEPAPLAPSPAQATSGFELVQRARAARLGLPVTPIVAAPPIARPIAPPIPRASAVVAPPRRPDPVAIPRVPMRGTSSPPEPVTFTAPPAAFMASPVEAPQDAAILGTPHVEPRYHAEQIRLARRMPPAPSQTCGSSSSSTPGSASPSARPGLASPATAVHLRVLPVEQITGQDDSFHCPPFTSTVRAKTCLDRQKLAATEQPEGSSRQARETRKNRSTFARCRGCVTGISVEAQLAEAGAVVAAE